MKTKVAITQNEDIQASVAAAFRALEDLTPLFADKHVAIKPNDTWASRRDKTACTQAETLEAVIKQIKRFKPKKITVTGGSGDAETDDVFNILGLDKVIEQEGVEFFDHNRPPFEAVKLDHGPQNKVMVNPYIFKYEAVVSLAQLKVHQSATVTLTMKNVAMSYPAADYYGHPRETGLHPYNFFDDLHGFIAGMCKRFPFAMGIIVGHPAMLGTGPIGGEAVETGLTIAGTDFVAVDSVGARILGHKRVRHIIEAAELGLGTASAEEIETPCLNELQAREILYNRKLEAERTTEYSK
jgi:uncharacterized protein (DUF362 family)